MFSEFELPLGFEDCRTGQPRKPRAGRSDASLNASWNELERDASDREREQAASYRVASWLIGEREL
ncbi:hypothetical protein DY000_02013104 [Brassica cretica]|uniref:Uncharacterized protein n=1 Tax=Brassica cretica TaxID=69181 RepID=A0ABQ7CRX8_BRACR|nr:hypothetical protein DY000_02013104 [Brassica cretica]